MNYSSRKNRKRSRYPFYFVLGALILYLVFAVIPGIAGIFYSFTDWSGYTTKINFIGLDNFKTIFSPDENYLLYIKDTFIFTLITIVLKTALGLALALILTEGVKRLAYFYRMLIYLPVVLPALAVALIFRSILNPATGLLNTTLRGVGLGMLAQKWLVDPHIALYSVIGVDTWQGCRIYHGHLDRRPSSHPPGILRGRRCGWSWFLVKAFLDYPAIDDARYHHRHRIEFAVCIKSV